MVLWTLQTSNDNNNVKKSRFSVHGTIPKGTWGAKTTEIKAFIILKKNLNHSLVLTLFATCCWLLKLG
jgi:hypothetical protein